MKLKIVAIGSAFLLGACATYNLTLTPRDAGAIAHGVAH